MKIAYIIELVHREVSVRLCTYRGRHKSLEVDYNIVGEAAGIKIIYVDIIHDITACIS